MNSNRKPFSDQIKVLMDEFGTGKLSAMTEISDTMLRKWRSGSSLPGLDKLLALSDATGASLEWLTTGIGNKHYSANSAGNLDTDEFAKVNLYDAEVSMGSGSWNENDRVIHPIAFRRDWLKSQGLDSDKCAAILARGDSMEPTIGDGATLLIDLADNSISRDGVYVIRFDGHLLAKRLQRSFDGSVFIKSDNPAYEKVHVASSQVNDINIVGRVVWYASVI